ncbi:MAG: DUF294 nucleotidyltransferase-like domain-containing protein [Paracoccaceae bacterium]
MTRSVDEIRDFLATLHPWDTLRRAELETIAGQVKQSDLAEGEEVYALGAPLPGLFILQSGEVEVRDENGAPVSLLGPRNSFGERGLLRDGRAVTEARATAATRLLILPVEAFRAAMAAHDPVRRFFDRSRGPRPRGQDLATSRVETLMAAPPVTCSPDITVQDAARLMRERRISCLCVTEDETLTGILTTRDLSARVLAEGLPADTAVGRVMTPDPQTLPPSAIGSDVLHAMMERRIGHVPVMEGGRLVGIVTQTDLTRFQAVSSAELVGDIAMAPDAAAMARVTARIPRLLAQLVAGGNRHEVVTRLITDIADAATRRLLALAEARLGPPPVPYLWLACGSQGRQEQTGVSDQDNGLILDDAATEEDMRYFADLARFVSDGLDACGYFYCPGDMMATNPRWCQPLRVWREYFRGWIERPSPEAQMLASVMFDLRPIGGETRLIEDLRAETLAAAARNSIFMAHIIANSVKHAPPLGLLRGFATIRSGEHRNTLDLKHAGVVPVVDLARVYALQGRLPEVGTRARLEAAQSAGVLSRSGGRDLLDAYDLIAETRLAHQARQVRGGGAPDNFMPPSELSEFERSHLRDAFVVVRSMQSALSHARGAPL